MVGETGPPGTFPLRTRGRLRVVLIPVCASFRHVPALIMEERVLARVCQVHETLRRWNSRSPHIARTGLNHARGDEERRAMALR